MVTQWPHRQRGTLSSFVDCHVPHFPAALLGNIAGRCPAFSFPCIIQHSLRQQTRAGRCLLKALEHRKPNTETASDIALPPHLILALLVRIRTVLAQRELGGHPLTPFDDRRRPFPSAAQCFMHVSAPILLPAQTSPGKGKKKAQHMAACLSPPPLHPRLSYARVQARKKSRTVVPACTCVCVFQPCSRQLTLQLRRGPDGCRHPSEAGPAGFKKHVHIPVPGSGSME